MATVKLGWGKHRNGKLVHINEAERGKQCNCVCPDCETSLIARQGDVTAWHFAHSQPVECYGESVLHKVAKQIISEAAGSQKKFLIPGLEKELVAEDVIGKPYVVNWKYSQNSLLIAEAKEEIAIGNGLITDILISSNSLDSKLAVEIFVTHKKSEFDIQKFSEIKHDVIEIDLSNVDPLADRNTIEEQVLNSPNRYWLFNKEESEQWVLFQKQLQAYNESYIEELLKLVLPAIEADNLDLLKFMWPQLTKNVSQNGLFGEVVFGKALKTPKITKLNVDNKYDVTKYGCQTEAIVEDKVRVTACFILLNTDIPNVSKDKPLVVFEYDPGSKQFYLSWYQIDKWLKRLTLLAEQNLKANLNLQRQKYQNQLTYAKNFSDKPDIEKIQLLASELQLPPPYNSGQYLSHWNTTWHVWKALVWKYKILKKQGKMINVENISEDRWLAQLLNWPQTEQAQIQRSKNIWFWFSRDLAKLGVVEHDERMFFYVSSDLPQKFVPWIKVV